MVDVPNFISIIPFASGPTILRSWAGGYGSSFGFTQQTGIVNGIATFANTSQQDAFRHAFVAAALYLEQYGRTPQIAGALGVSRDSVATTRALGFGFMNEAYASNPLQNHLKDLWNNFEGVNIAREIIHTYGSDLGPKITNEQLAAVVAGYVQESTAAGSGEGRLVLYSGSRSDDPYRDPRTYPGNFDVMRLPDPSDSVERFLIPQEVREAFPDRYRDAHCFVAGTPILMADGNTKPIEEVAVGDVVASFDPQVQKGRGPLRAGRVTRTFRNEQFTFSFLAMRVTPGHRFLTGEGTFERLDRILEYDGTVVNQAGEEVRARTGFQVGSPEDQPVNVLYVDATGLERKMWMRGGMICDDRMMGRRRAMLTAYKAMEQQGFKLRADGLFEAPDGTYGPISWEGVPGEHLELGRHVAFPRLLKLHREATPLMSLLGGKRVPNPLAAESAAEAMRRVH